MSRPGSVQLSLRVGPDEPGLAPSSLLGAVRKVEVTENGDGPSTFAVTFATEVVDAAAGSFAVVADALLRPFDRLLVRVSVDGSAQTLVDGFITGQGYVPSNGAESTFTVTGEDVSVKMDVVDWSREFPCLPDGLIVEALLAPWLLLGIVPDVQPTPSDLVPFDHVPQQAGTDRQTIQQLAKANGCVFFVRPTADLFGNRAYWGPPPRGSVPQALLDVTVGPTSTVESISFTQDARGPRTFFGLVMETTIDPFVPIPLLTVESMRGPAYAADPTLSASSLVALTTRKKLWRDSRLDPVRALAQAQAATDASTDHVVVGTCEVEVARLGTVLTAPGTVGVRGAGRAYDGLYHLESVVHRVDLTADEQWDYHQALTITREGLGTTTATLEAS